MLQRKIKAGEGDGEYKACVCVCHIGWLEKYMPTKWHLLRDLKKVKGLAVRISGEGAFLSENSAKVLG